MDDLEVVIIVMAGAFAALAGLGIALVLSYWG